MINIIQIETMTIQSREFLRKLKKFIIQKMDDPVPAQEELADLLLEIDRAVYIARSQLLDAIDETASSTSYETDTQAIDYLKSRGIKFDPWHTMHLPNPMDEEVFAAARYLKDEWDFAYVTIGRDTWNQDGTNG